MVCSVGLEARDYPTLLTAVHGLSVRVTITAASPWSKRADPTRNREIPANVCVCFRVILGRQCRIRYTRSDSRFAV